MEALKQIKREDVQPPGVIALLEEMRAAVATVENMAVELARRAYSLGVKDGAAQQRRVGT